MSNSQMFEEPAKEEIIRNNVYHFMREAMSDDYSDLVAEAILPDVIADVNECADAEDWNEDDVRLAIGRVLCWKLGIPR